MAGVKFEVNEVSVGVMSLLHKLGNKEKWLSILKSVAATVGLGDIIRHFRAEEGPNGKWVDLNKDYKKWRLSKGKTKMLQFTGNLRRSFLPTNVRDNDSSSVILFNPVGYADRHDLGFSGTENVPAHKRLITQAFGKKLKEPKAIDIRAHSKKVSIPQRKFMWISQRGKDLMAQGLVKQILS